METIASRRNPLVATCRALARRRDPDERRILLDGHHLLEAACTAGLPILVAAFATQRLDGDEDGLRQLAATLAASGTRVVRATESVIDALSPVRSASGVVAIAEHTPASLDQIFAPPPPLVLILADVQDPGNVGAAIRAADAAGASGIVAIGTTADPFGWKALRGAMGSAFRIPVIRQREAAPAIAAIHARGVRILAAEPRGGRPVYDINLTRPVAILLGGEGAGLSPELARVADDTITLPMRSPVESLNVAVTAALVVYEAFRQRTAR